MEGTPDPEFSGVLDLTSADTKGFEALPSGTYDCELFEWKLVGTKGGPNAKLPAGTPMIKLQFKVIEEPYENRRFFDQIVLPPKDHDKEKAAKMLGGLTRFLVAMGMEESEITASKKFVLADALENLVGEPVRVVVGRAPKYGQEGLPANEQEYDNPVKGYKRVGTGATAQLL